MAQFQRDVEFQFQTGAIKRKRETEIQEYLARRFNSKLVRLKVHAGRVTAPSLHFVSIPNWCD